MAIASQAEGKANNTPMECQGDEHLQNGPSCHNLCTATAAAVGQHGGCGQHMKQCCAAVRYGNSLFP